MVTITPEEFCNIMLCFNATLYFESSVFYMVKKFPLNYTIISVVPQKMYKAFYNYCLIRGIEFAVCVEESDVNGIDEFTTWTVNSNCCEGTFYAELFPNVAMLDRTYSIIDYSVFDISCVTVSIHDVKIKQSQYNCSILQSIHTKRFCIDHHIKKDTPSCTTLNRCLLLLYNGWRMSYNKEQSWYIDYYKDITSDNNNIIDSGYCCYCSKEFLATDIVLKLPSGIIVKPSCYIMGLDG